MEQQHVVVVATSSQVNRQVQEAQGLGASCSAKQAAIRSLQLSRAAGARRALLCLGLQQVHNPYTSRQLSPKSVTSCRDRAQ
jgi:hypothetical protein